MAESRDTNNNFVRYTYVKDGGQIYPDTIRYTGNGVTDGAFSVVFVREQRSDVRVSYAPGFQVQTNYRISEVRTEDNGTWVRKYDLGYIAGSNGASSLLGTVALSGRASDGSTTVLPNTSFTYQTPATTWSRDTSWAIPEWFVATGTDNGSRLVDYNGDGRPDLVNSRGSTSNAKAYVNTGSSWTLDSSRSVPVLVTANGEDNGVRFFDYDGDGATDVVYSEIDFNGVSDFTANNGYRNTGTSWSLTSSNAVPADYFADVQFDKGGRIADVNGDGLPDLIGACDETMVYNHPKCGNGPGDWYARFKTVYTILIVTSLKRHWNSACLSFFSTSATRPPTSKSATNVPSSTAVTAIFAAMIRWISTTSNISSAPLPSWSKLWAASWQSLRLMKGGDNQTVPHAREAAQSLHRAR